MLNVLGSKQRFCDGMSRRDFLKVGSGFGAGLPIYLLLRHNSFVGGYTGKTVQKPASVLAKTASPEVTGGSNDSGSGGSDSGESSGDGGEDDPPRFAAFYEEEPPRKPSILDPIFRLIAFVLSILTLPLQLLPDFVSTMRLFDFVFPDDIHDKHYAPGKLRLLREMCCSRDGEYFESTGRILWKGFWRRVRFGSLVVHCFLRWIGSLVWDLFKVMF